MLPPSSSPVILQPSTFTARESPSAATAQAAISQRWWPCTRATLVGPPLCFQLLIYPATDQNLESDSLARNGEGYLLTRTLMEKFRSYYLPRPADYVDWRASPARAKSHAGLPPAFVLTGGFDPLLDDGRQYVELLARAGVEVAYRDYADMIHGFILMGGVLDTANAAVADCCAALRRAFDKVTA